MHYSAGVAIMDHATRLKSPHTHNRHLKVQHLEHLLGSGLLLFREVITLLLLQSSDLFQRL